MKFKVEDNVRYIKTGTIGVVKGYDDWQGAISNQDILYIISFNPALPHRMMAIPESDLEPIPTHIQIPNQPIDKDKVRKGQKIWVKALIEEDGMGHCGLVAVRIYKPFDKLVHYSNIREREED